MGQQDDNYPHLASTGVPGLDKVLAGGLTPERLYLVEGEPGTGKTTLALQFIGEGVRAGEAALYVTLGESAAELRASARSHGWDMAGVSIEEIIPGEDILDPEQQYSIFHPSEIELGMTTQRILAAVEQHKPRRMVLDSLSELQLLAESPLRYRRQMQALKQYLSSRACTALFVDDRAAFSGELQVRSVAHAVIALELLPQAYGADRRRLHITKYRGVAFRSGAHDYKIVTGGLRVFPRLVAADTRQEGPRARLSSNLAALDALMGGGLEEGMSTLISGPPGTGKSTLATQFVHAATQRGEACAMFLFEESRNNLLNRASEVGLGLQAALQTGLLSIQQVDPAELSPGEFSQSVVDAAERGARLVVIDSLNGYLNAVPDERFLPTYLHEVLSYLGQHGVASVLVGVQQSMLGTTMTTSADASYVADNVIMLRYFESGGEVMQAISVFKKRGGAHARTIHRFEIGPRGIEIGPALRGFHGILTGVPTSDRHAAAAAGG
ncbi:ATPase domain-containing protein [Janthinobacterium fluminis]|uniref:non-specific serine/threonine protein kinase n=1 Tax=Janthinobacterium fluminis TaxID=2987524 RepID=A0ABT5K3S6_9BURK|nr:ATPase domain-containing protein [Janthinobacterium fluminis]MDC8759058.1 ATPase domain-containing protein [Janthinobacterium fluminis]